MHRRQFLATTSIAVASAVCTRFESGLARADDEAKKGVPLGLDGHSMRGMKWKAGQLIAFVRVYMG